MIKFDHTKRRIWISLEEKTEFELKFEYLATAAIFLMVFSRNEFLFK